MFYTREQVGEMMMLNPLVKMLRWSREPERSPHEWLGKMVPSYCQPLTLEWFKVAMKPTFNEVGEARYILTPPRHRGVRTDYYAGVLILILIVVGLAAWARQMFLQP